MWVTFKMVHVFSFVVCHIYCVDLPLTVSARMLLIFKCITWFLFVLVLFFIKFIYKCLSKFIDFVVYLIFFRYLTFDWIKTYQISKGMDFEFFFLRIIFFTLCACYVQIAQMYTHMHNILITTVISEQFYKWDLDISNEVFWYSMSQINRVCMECHLNTFPKERATQNLSQIHCFKVNSSTPVRLAKSEREHAVNSAHRYFWSFFLGEIKRIWSSMK